MINTYSPFSNPLMTGDESEVALPDSSESSSVDSESESGGNTATLTPPQTRPQQPKLDRMPPWKVLLHNDDQNEMGYVIETITELTALTPQTALIRMLEAHDTGVALLLATHQEYAELLQEQFASKQLVVTIEPDR